MPPPIDRIDAAFNMLEHVFVRYKEIYGTQTNQLSAVEKAHLQLLRASLDKEIAQQLFLTMERASESSDRLGKQVYWLNVVVAVLTTVLAISAVLELFQ